MSNEYTLFPSLSEEAQKEAEQLIENFKKQLIKIAEDAIGNLYSDIIFYIKSDSWQNFRNELMDGLRNYNNRKIQAEYDFEKIRREIYNEFKDEIIKDLDQDNLQRIKKLEEKNAELRNENKELINKLYYQTQSKKKFLT